jgi:hypothetical protein
VTTSTNGGPSTIYIIRHGEKLGDPAKDDDHIKDLSVWGSARASALPSLFLAATPELSCALTTGTNGFTAQYTQNSLSGEAPRFPPPDFLFATEESSSSNRPVETISPLSAALNLTLNAPYPDGQYCELANEIKSNPAYANKIVLVCWHHGTIPQLAVQFGVVNPPPWDGTVFDRVWEIAYTPGPVALKDHPQRLLYGDSHH